MKYCLVFITLVLTCNFLFSSSKVKQTEVPYSPLVDTVQDFVCKLYMKPHMYQGEYNFRIGRGFQVWNLHLKISPWEEKPCLPWANFWRWRNFHREHSHMTSDVFWLFLTYLPTLSYSITSHFRGYLRPPYLP